VPRCANRLRATAVGQRQAALPRGSACLPCHQRDLRPLARIPATVSLPVLHRPPGAHSGITQRECVQRCQSSPRWQVPCSAAAASRVKLAHTAEKGARAGCLQRQPSSGVGNSKQPGPSRREAASRARRTAGKASPRCTWTAYKPTSVRSHTRGCRLLWSQRRRRQAHGLNQIASLSLMRRRARPRSRRCPRRARGDGIGVRKPCSESDADCPRTVSQRRWEP